MSGTGRFRPTVGTPKKPDDSDTEVLLKGEEITRKDVNPTPPWEVGELLSILNKDWKVVCRAKVIAALETDEGAAYTLRGLPLGETVE